jgi:signal transduction histidine kinase
MSIRSVSPFPIVDLVAPAPPSNGSELSTPSFCKKQFLRNARCSEFYLSLVDRPDGFYECPFGFGCCKFTYSGKWAWTSLILFPRFGSLAERERAKAEPSARISRESVSFQLRILMEFEKRLSKEYENRIRETPPAFHELRKLNRTIKQGAESLRNDFPENDLVRKIHGASELLSNQFDILELLATEEILTSRPSHSKQIEAVIFKCAKILEARANQKRMTLDFRLTPGTAQIHPKSFPIVPSVLIDNAIRYGVEGSPIVLRLDWPSDRYCFWVENQCATLLPSEKLFLKGSRLFPKDGEGSGLGLYLVKQIAMQHGGAVRFEQANGIVRFGIEMPANGGFVRHL